MQNIINQIQTGDMTDNQLLKMLNDFNNKTIDEYNEVCEIAESLQSQIDSGESSLQTQINKLEADARVREQNIKTIEKNALKSVEYAKTLEADNTRLKFANKELKALKADNKKLKAQVKRQAEANKKAATRAESITKQWKDQSKQITVLKSDVARLRLTGQKNIGKYSFTIFPSKISGEGSNEKRVCLVASDNSGNMKCVTIDDGVVVQPRSHNFKFDDEQEQFVHDFDRIAKEDNYNFTDRVLSLVN